MLEPQPGCSKDFISQDEVHVAKCKMESDGGQEVQDGSGYGILDLSDDVLLIILKHCSPRDLKALGFTCERLGQLVCDRSLWCRVDARDCGMGRTQLSWYLDHTISTHTVSLALRGFAEEAKGCLGTVDAPRPIIDPPARTESPKPPEPEPVPPVDPPPGPSRQPCFHFQRNYNPQLPRFNVSPVWREDITEPIPDGEDTKPERLKNTGGCGGPRWTLARDTLADIHSVCPKLTELRLEYVNINCDVTPISSFPPTLKALSMRGSRCYNLEINKSYLFRIHEFMPLLEMVDIGLCGWMEPATLLPLSKLPELRTLLMDRCRRLSECVAYASLAARYGFRKLRVLNMMGTPMGDSEVSGLGWLPDLEELYLEPAEAHEPVEHHSHYLDDPRAAKQDMEPWEREEPEYFRSESKPPSGCSSCATPEPALSMEASREVVLTGAGEPGGARSLAVVHYRRYNQGNRGRRHIEFLEKVARQRVEIEQRARELRGVHRLRRMPRLVPRTAPVPGPSTRQRSRSNDDAPQAKRSKRFASATDKPVTRSKSQQESAEAAGPSASTRSKKPVVETPSTSARMKRPQAKPVETPLNKRRRCQSAGPSTSQAIKTPKAKKSPKAKKTPKGKKSPKKHATPNQEERPAEERIEPPNAEEVNPEQGEGRQNQDVNGEAPPPRPFNEQSPEERREQMQDLQRRLQQRRLELYGRREGNEINEDLDDYYGEGRVHVIYVNVRRPRRDVFRMLVQEEEPRVIEGNRVEYERAVLNVVEVPRRDQPDERPEALRNGPEFAIMPDGMRQGINRDNVMNILRMPFIQNFLYGPPGGGHVSGASLISDAAITRFGRSDNADVVNYVHIGPNGAVRAGVPPGNQSDRPDKSKLKVLVCRGFTGITNRSLNHLVTAAPDLKFIDVTGTKVTEQDAAAFKNLRPDCEIRYTVKREN